MTADEIKALVERLRDRTAFIMQGPAHVVRAGEAAATALEILSYQLTAKTALANLYAASLRQSEAEVEGLKVENQRLRVDAERYRWLKSMSRCEMFELGLELSWYAPTEDLDAGIDAARAKMVKEKP